MSNRFCPAFRRRHGNKSETFASVPHSPRCVHRSTILLCAANRSITIPCDVCRTTGITLQSCGELRKFDIPGLCLGTMEADVVSSISSKNIERITSTDTLASSGSETNTCWTQLDNSLCQSVEFLGREYRLAVEFQLYAHYLFNSNHKRYLPKFQRKGQVRIVDKGTGVLLHFTLTLVTRLYRHI